jgi:hypothetical protein
MKNEKKAEHRRMVGFRPKFLEPIDRAYIKERKIQGRGYFEINFLEMLINLGMTEYQKKVGK